MGTCGHISSVTCPNCYPLRGDTITVPYSDMTLKVTKPGAWVAYNADDSGTTLFATEIDALRYAVSFGMQVKFVEYGSNI